MDAHPDAHLYVTYKKPDNVESHKGVTFLGRLDDREMTELYKKVDVLTYPCTGGERFCLTALKAQVYGAIPCVVPTMALNETVKYGIKSSHTNYLGAIIDLLKDLELREEIRVDMKNIEFSTWSDVVDQWIGLING
jgi:glycosyltransferase involved in cell wall biosynthesis